MKNSSPKHLVSWNIGFHDLLFLGVLLNLYSLIASVIVAAAIGSFNVVIVALIIVNLFLISKGLITKRIYFDDAGKLQFPNWFFGSRIIDIQNIEFVEIKKITRSPIFQIRLMKLNNAITIARTSQYSIARRISENIAFHLNCKIVDEGFSQKVIREPHQINQLILDAPLPEALTLNPVGFESQVSSLGQYNVELPKPLVQWSTVLFFTLFGVIFGALWFFTYNSTIVIPLVIAGIGVGFAFIENVVTGKEKIDLSLSGFTVSKAIFGIECLRSIPLNELEEIRLELDSSSIKPEQVPSYGKKALLACSDQKYILFGSGLTAVQARYLRYQLCLQAKNILNSK